MIAKLQAVLAVIFIVSLVFAPTANAMRAQTAGGLDPTFSEDSTLIVGDIAPGFDAAYREKIQPDGKIVTLSAVIDGNETSRLILHRFTPNGDPDTTIGDDGSVESSFVNCCSLLGLLLIQPDGKIIAVGSSGGGFALARFILNTRLDESIGENGKVITSKTGEMSIHAAELTSDQKLVVIGKTNSAPGIIERYDLRGALESDTPLSYI